RTATWSHCCFSAYCLLAVQHLHSFPTRRSSDLEYTVKIINGNSEVNCILESFEKGFSKKVSSIIEKTHPNTILIQMISSQLDARSEEHTSELQSRFDLVCRLLLAKEYHNNQQLI